MILRVSKPKANCFEFDNLVVVAFVALAKSKGMPQTQLIRKVQRSKNPDVVVVDNERERGERDISLNYNPSLAHPSSFVNISKRKRSSMREIVELKFVIQKLLTLSDVDRNKYRMSILIREIRNEFLRSEEKAMFDSCRKEKEKIKGREVELIEPSCEG
ncbi:hypothetical protein RHMOL_Rhmol07G0191600 [Rhododendron molle]|uniref:Uncharacterized protein n=1 Tax=Rhododendron molle TaxID=49168 RepID=A0ACC0N4D0_RHOML|nr:hypothetical protein RHMOL_Rhmol07G0191600 [Rhododendron molle]